MPRAEFQGERFFVFTARDRNRAVPGSGRELNSEIAQAAETEYGNEVARPRIAVAGGSYRS